MQGQGCAPPVLPFAGSESVIRRAGSAALDLFGICGGGFVLKCSAPDLLQYLDDVQGNEDD